MLFLQEGSQAQDVLDVFRGAQPAAPADVAPAAVTVRVLNGTGVRGQAAAARDGLAVAGFTVAGVGDGTSGTSVTTIRYGAGQEAKAALLRRFLVEPSANLVEDPALEGVDAVLLTGATYAGVLAEPRPVEEAPAPTVPTTEAPATDGGAPAPEAEC